MEYRDAEVERGFGPRPRLDPDPEEMRRLAYRTVDLVVEHLASLSDQRVARRGTAADFAAQVDEPLPRQGRSLEENLEFFARRVVPGMTRVNHPRFHAYIPCPSSFYSAMGELLAAGTNPFVGSWLGAGTLASLELTVLRWVAEAVGYPQDAAGIFTSGGSMANLTALGAARARYGHDTLSRGTLYFSQEGHTSAEKAAQVLGYPEEALRRVPADAEFRMDLEALHSLVAEDRRAGRRPFLVCANAGTINTGAVDPLVELARYCRREDLWFHIDGAYGGFAALCPWGRKLLAGMEEADSLTLDPHKWLYASMGTGCVLVRDREALERAFLTHGHYLKDVPQDEVNFFHRGPELSRPGRVLAVWMLLRCVGLDELARQVEHDLRLARLAARLLEEDERLEVVTPPQLSIVAFRHRRRPGESVAERNARDTDLMERLLEDGTVMLSTTDLGEDSALRLVVMNHRTCEEEVRRTVTKIRQLVA